MFQRIFFYLNADIRNSGNIRCKKLTLCSRCDFQPISGRKADFFSINYGFAITRKNSIDFFVFLMRMNKWDICSCRKFV